MFFNVVGSAWDWNPSYSQFLLFISTFSLRCASPAFYMVLACRKCISWVSYNGLLKSSRRDKYLRLDDVWSYYKLKRKMQI